MCGRYFVDRQVLSALQKYSEDDLNVTTRDIHPGDKAPVILFGQRFYVRQMTWGLPAKQGLHINARVESVLERPTFKEDFQQRRCIIPCRRFYEWDYDHRKVSFYEDEERIVYLAGFYDRQDHFIIMTTAANESMIPIHDRMPFILEATELRFYFDDERYLSLLHKKMPQLKNDQSFKQMSLFDEP